MKREEQQFVISMKSEFIWTLKKKKKDIGLAYTEKEDCDLLPLKAVRGEPQ